ncbi:hypothetical protein GF337_11460 [candidate division KSB1 bacterium]|nr:hypothetical protein [candidate division KSB1 bacterium]
MIYWISAYILKFFARIYLRATASGLENYPEKGPFIGIFNHNSNMDIAALSVAVKHRVHTMAKDSLFEVPLLAWWLKAVCMFPVVRDSSDKEAFNHAVNVLKKGEILFMAPEGTRKKRKGQKHRIRTGFIRLAHLAKCPIVPVAVYGTEKVLPPGGVFPKPVKVSVKVGKPFHLDNIDHISKDKKEVLQKQADEAMAEVYKLVDEMAQKSN